MKASAKQCYNCGTAVAHTGSLALKGWISAHFVVEDMCDQDIVAESSKSLCPNCAP
jgi:ribosomal protein S27AE